MPNNEDNKRVVPPSMNSETRQISDVLMEEGLHARPAKIPPRTESALEKCNNLAG